MQGTDLNIRIPNVTDANNVLITNWTGVTVKAQVRDRVESPDVLYEWSGPGVGSNVTTSGSDVLLAVAHAVSSAWTWRHGRYDVELTNASGAVARIAEGHMFISREVTR